MMLTNHLTFWVFYNQKGQSVKGPVHSLQALVFAEQCGGFLPLHTERKTVLFVTNRI